MNIQRITTLGQFIIERQSEFPYSKGQLSRLLRDIGIASKIVNREVNKAGLVNILGDTGETNVQGEKVKKLDIFANEQFKAALTAGGECCVFASEEDDDILPIDGPVSADAKYVVLIDPLDGSSNIDVNVSVGTIFSIYRRVSESGPGLLSDCLKGHASGRCWLRRLRFIHHVGLYHRAWGERFYPRPIHRGILLVASQYADSG